jgi:hypothetical protein
MHQKIRRIILLAAILIFVSVSYVVILYAQGYRYDFKAGQFIRTGAVDVKVNTQAKIFINGKLYGTTSFLSNTGSFGGLLPDTYKIEITKDGYSTWTKNITIEEGFVQHFPRVMILPNTGEDLDNLKKEITALLYPPTPSPSPTIIKSPTASPTKKPIVSLSPSPTPTPSGPFYVEKGILYVQSLDGFEPIAHGIDKTYLSEDKQKITWFTGRQLWVYWLSDTNYQPVHKLGDIALIATLKTNILTANWFRDNDHIVVDVGSVQKPDYRIIELDNRGGTNIISL